MKSKILPIVILVIFLVGLFPAILAQDSASGVAQQQGTGNTNGNTGDTNGGESSVGEAVPPSSERAIIKRPAIVSEKLKARLANVPEQAKVRWQAVNAKRVENIAKLQELKAKPAFVNFKQELNFRARKLNINRLKELKQNYVWAKEKLIKAREMSQLAHTKFLGAKNRLATCTENCEELEAEILQNAKDFLLRTADSIINHLEKVKNKVESSEDLTEEEASEILTKIATEIQKLEDAKLAVEAATTKEEVREASNTILSAWKRIKRHSYYHVGKLINARQGGIIVKLKHLELRIQRVIEKMEESGKDTSEIQLLLDEFHRYLESAKENFELAKEKFREFKGLPEPKGEEGNALIKEAQRYMDEARKQLEEAHKTLREIVKAIKEANGATELAETTEEESEEE